MEEFYVNRIKVAKEMVKRGCPCIGCELDRHDFFLYLFEKNEKTMVTYKQVRKDLGLDK